MLGRGCGLVKCFSSSQSPKQLKADSGIFDTRWAVAYRSITLPSFNGLCINVTEIALFIYLMLDYVDKITSVLSFACFTHFQT